MRGKTTFFYDDRLPQCLFWLAGILFVSDFVCKKNEHNENRVIHDGTMITKYTTPSPSVSLSSNWSGKSFFDKILKFIFGKLFFGFWSFKSI